MATLRRSTRVVLAPVGAVMVWSAVLMPVAFRLPLAGRLGHTQADRCRGSGNGAEGRSAQSIVTPMSVLLRVLAVIVSVTIAGTTAPGLTATSAADSTGAAPAAQARVAQSPSQPPAQSPSQSARTAKARAAKP